MAYKSIISFVWSFGYGYSNDISRFSGYNIVNRRAYIYGIRLANSEACGWRVDIMNSAHDLLHGLL